MDIKKEKENWETESSRDFHRKQYIEPKRSTVAFDNFLEKCGRIKTSKRIIDFGCGGGAADVYLARQHEKLYIDGIDIVDSFFYLFHEFASEEIKKRVSLYKGDIYKIRQALDRKYDGIISVQTISFMENWQNPIEQMCNLDPEWIGISALFYEGRIDYQIKIRDYEEKGLTQDFTEKYYNIYPIPLVKDFLRERGYTKFVYEPFEIDIDIPKPAHMNVGTYTIKTEEGKRLQISAALLMPWYFIYASK